MGGWCGSVEHMMKENPDIYPPTDEADTLKLIK